MLFDAATAAALSPSPVPCSATLSSASIINQVHPVASYRTRALFTFLCFAHVLPRHFLFVIQPPLSSSFQRSTFQSTAPSASQPAPDRRPPPKRRPSEGPADASRTSSPIPPARHVGPVREGAHLRIHRLSEGPFRETDSIAGQRPRRRRTRNTNRPLAKTDTSDPQLATAVVPLPSVLEGTCRCSERRPRRCL